MITDRHRLTRNKTQTGYSLRLSRPGDSTPVRTKTAEISAEGLFFCKSERPFSPEERLDCEMLNADAGLSGRGKAVSVKRCRVEVVRIVTTGYESGFIMACRLVPNPIPKRQMANATSAA